MMRDHRADQLDGLVGALIPSETAPSTAYRITGRARGGTFFTSFYALRVAPEGECAVVVKVLRPSFSQRLGAAAEIVVKKEAVSMGRLNERVPPTPFVVRLMDVGTFEAPVGGSTLSLPWITIEYVHGGALGATLRERVQHSIDTTGYAFDPARAVRAIGCVAGGLSAVHEVGVIHRDLTPDSILCSGSGDDEIFKISDFGLARPGGLDETLGIGLMGAGEIRAPELWLTHGRVGPWTDMFGFACVIYFMLTGEQLVAARAEDDLLSMLESRTRRSVIEGRYLHPTLRAHDSVCQSIDFALRWASAPIAEERLQEAESLAAILVPYLRPAVAASTAAQRGVASGTAGPDGTIGAPEVPPWVSETIPSLSPPPSTSWGRSAEAYERAAAVEAGASPHAVAPGHAAEGADRRPGAPNVAPGHAAEGADRRPGAPNVAPGHAAEGADRRPGAPNVAPGHAAEGADRRPGAPNVEIEAELESAPPAMLRGARRPRWTWTTLRHPGMVGVLRSLAWDGYGRCMAASSEGLLFWNGQEWCEMVTSSLPQPRGVRFVHKVGPGRWVVGGDESMLAAYTTGGVAGILPRPGNPERYLALSGDAGDMGVLAVAPPKGHVLLRGFVGRHWLKPCEVDGAGQIAGLARVEDEHWLIAGRTPDGRGMLALCAPLDWQVERLPIPEVRALRACVGIPEAGFGAAVGTNGTVIFWTEGRIVVEIVDPFCDLSAVAVSADGDAWAAAAGRIWHRSPAEPGAGDWTCVWSDDSWIAPVISLFVDFGVLVAATADGGLLEGRLTD